MELNEEQQRIRGYLQTQAAKLSLDELCQKVKADMEQVHAAVGAVPPARFSERPADGEWSANEVMSHIVSGAKGVGGDIVAVLDNGARPGPAFDRIEKEDQARSAGDWWSDLVAERDTLFARVATAAGDEHPDIKWNHPMFGPLNWREWLLFLRIHDLDHARQIQSITAALG